MREKAFSDLFVSSLAVFMTGVFGCYLFLTPLLMVTKIRGEDRIPDVASAGYFCVQVMKNVGEKLRCDLFWAALILNVEDVREVGSTIFRYWKLKPGNFEDGRCP